MAYTEIIIVSDWARRAFEYIACQEFLFREKGEEGVENLELYGDITQTYEVYAFIAATATSFHALTRTDFEYNHTI